ncbi:hypothetical protein [Actinoplanes philippinensis]|uniref:hypothetical protein n=1 Tax=Actinoplanes philippinensis TaxID=35752 RepID=UPI00340E9453
MPAAPTPTPTSGTRTPPDLPGTALSLAGLSAVVYGLTNAGAHSWTSTVVVLADIRVL